VNQVYEGRALAVLAQMPLNLLFMYPLMPVFGEAISRSATLNTPKKLSRTADVGYYQRPSTGIKEKA
jgi:hypothetical protein